MAESSALGDFYRLCTAIEAKPQDGLSTLELELRELGEFRSYVGGGGSISYFLENSDAKPSRLASLFTKVGPSQLAAMLRDSSKIFPDDMPSNFSEKQAFVEQRLANLGKLNLESFEETGFDAIDSYFCRPEENAIFAAAMALLGQSAA
ncbi:MAG TPA: hypothetical protein VLA61_16830 [Ideonella sp.]|uniref:hypothetical protein n=1 Tax=Ideonella sp. TaxID=1929293 RepID=UPI002BB7B678|nr:hypothetical protein [Ideonella sp.]HSI49939.1 hypothetical protein [Ideonella sp.]